MIRPYTPTSPPDARGYLDLVRLRVLAMHLVEQYSAALCLCLQRACMKVCGTFALRIQVTAGK